MDNCSTWVCVLECLLEVKSIVFWDGKLKLLRQIVEKLITCGWKMAKGQMQKVRCEVLTEAKRIKEQPLEALLVARVFAVHC